MRINRVRLVSLTFFLLFIFLTTNLFSQHYSITGNVNTPEGPARFVKIRFIPTNDLGSSQVAITDEYGNFYIDLVTGVKNEQPIKPENIYLGQNYPNPFEDETVIPYSKKDAKSAKIIIYNILGQMVNELNLPNRTPGANHVKWDGNNIHGRKVSPGIYFYRLINGNESLTKKMVYSLSSNLNLPVTLYKENKTKQYLNSHVENHNEFFIEILNSNNSAPGIIRYIEDAVSISSDTTFNFTVEKEFVEKYYLYLVSQGGPYVYLYDTEYHSVVDSIYVDRTLWYFDVTRSGRKMYVSSSDEWNTPDAVYTVDVQTRNVNKIYDGYAEVYVPKNGQPVIIEERGNDETEVIGIVDTLTDEITWLDTMDLASGAQRIAFDPNGPNIYGLSYGQLFKYSLEKREVIERYGEYGNLSSRFVIDGKGEHIYFAGGYSVNIEKDSVVGDFRFSPTSNLGEIAISSLENFVCVTDPGKWRFFEIKPSGKIAIFRDLPEGREKGVSYIDINRAAAIHNTTTEITHIELTRDNRKAFITTRGYTIFVLDIEKEIISDVIRLNNNCRAPERILLVPKE